MPLFRQAGAVQGEANCIRSLATRAGALGARRGARGLRGGVPLYRQVGDVQGEANCIRAWGHRASALRARCGARGVRAGAAALPPDGRRARRGQLHRWLGDMALDALTARRGARGVCPAMDGKSDAQIKRVVVAELLGIDLARWATCWARPTASRAWATSRCPLDSTTRRARRLSRRCRSTARWATCWARPTAI